MKSVSLTLALLLLAIPFLTSCRSEYSGRVELTAPITSGRDSVEAGDYYAQAKFNKKQSTLNISFYTVTKDPQARRDIIDMTSVYDELRIHFPNKVEPIADQKPIHYTAEELNSNFNLDVSMRSSSTTINGQEHTESCRASVFRDGKYITVYGTRTVAYTYIQYSTAILLQLSDESGNLIGNFKGQDKGGKERRERTSTGCMF